MKSALVEQPVTLSNPEPSAARTDSDDSKRKRAAVSNPSGGIKKSSSIFLIGASYKTSSVAFREALAERLSRESAELRRIAGAKEYADLITCNRVEIAMVTRSSGPRERAISAWVSALPNYRPGSVYVHKDVDAIAHLFRVASGLDSMVLGEEQILSQVREAGIMARASRSSRGSLSSLFDAAVNAGRRVRAALPSTDQSVSSMALGFALSRLPRAPRNVLLIGTGKTTRLAANQLHGAKLYVATRRSSLPSFSRATLIRHEDLGTVAAKCDLIIAATKQQGYVLREGELGGKRRRVILDLAFPRNIDPNLDASSTEVYNLDDLARVFASRQRPAGPEATLAEELVSAEVEGFARWMLASRQSSALSRVYRWAETTRRQEMEAALRRLPGLSQRDKKVVEAMSRRLVSKLMAPPTSFARSSTVELPQDQRLDLLQRVFVQAEV